MDSVLFEALAKDCQTNFANSVECFQSRRIFHGRGGLFPGLEWCVVDFFYPTVLVTLFAPPPEGFLSELKRSFESSWGAIKAVPGAVDGINLAVQKRYCMPLEVDWLVGQEPENSYAKRGSLKFTLNLRRQNVGYFLDMEPGRKWLESIVEGKSLLNLFAFTCAFSPIAIEAGATRVVNVDMSKSALSDGRENHRVNSISTEAVEFMPLDILKSWSRIRKRGPYEVIIIDPPSYQKGSFIAERDYPKVLRRLDELATKNADVLLCLNAPELKELFLHDMMNQYAGGWGFEKRLPLDRSFDDENKEKQLKILHFSRRNSS